MHTEIRKIEQNPIFDDSQLVHFLMQ